MLLSARHFMAFFTIFQSDSFKEIRIKDGNQSPTYSLPLPTSSAASGALHQMKSPSVNSPSSVPGSGVERIENNADASLHMCHGAIWQHRRPPGPVPAE